MAFTTIESSELVDKGVSGLSDTPDIEASDLKERFDSLGKLAIQKFQTHINELEANTASGSIGANVPAGLNASANVQSLIDALYLIIKDLKEYKHNHSNRDVLELITADVKESYDRLATIFNTISEVENVVTDNASKIPTSAAIIKLTQDIYANKNAEAVQAVEAAEAAQAETESVAADLREYADNVHDIISNLGRNADDALRHATATAEHAQTVLTTAETSANSAKTYAEQAQEAWERISNSGSTGVPGADGKSAYELAVDNGFSGTLAEWLNSLKGADGEGGNGLNTEAKNALIDCFANVAWTDSTGQARLERLQIALGIEIPEPTPEPSENTLYSLNSETTFDKSNYIDTNVSFETDLSFTVLLSVTFNSLSGVQTIFGNKSSNDSKGFCIYKTQSSKLALLTSAVTIIQDNAVNSGTRYDIALSHEVGTTAYTAIVNGIEKTTTIPSNAMFGNSKTAVLGGQYINTNMLDATVHKAEVRDIAMTAAEIDSYFGG